MEDLYLTQLIFLLKHKNMDFDNFFTKEYKHQHCKGFVTPFKKQAS